MEKVAVIGAGPGGLVAARYLQSEGFEPVIFEQGPALGGQWSGDPHHSGVWPSMHTNTSHQMTAFSDLPHAAESPLYPSNQDMRAYLHRYADQFDLTPRIRLSTPVQQIRRDSDGWLVRAAGREERFFKAVVATGRYNKPRTPPVQGIGTFSGRGGVTHTFGYKHPECYRGQHVLVAGCAISALEIASDLAMLGAASVTVTQRRQRYVLFKLLAGVPVEQVALTRFGALAAECFPMPAVGQGLKDFIVNSFGSPDQFGAPAPAADVFAAGITLCQHYLPLVAEGRIIIKPWMSAVDGNRVHFADGSAGEFDAIILGTGFELNLPFLGEEIRETLNVDAHHIDLYQHTFHPDLPGLAFLGLFEQAGPYFSVLELQARWIAYTTSGAVPLPSREQMVEGVAAYRSRRGGPQLTMSHTNALLFARAAGVEPDVSRWPELARALLFGPLAAVSFRLEGHDAIPDAAARYVEQARLAGPPSIDAITPQQRTQLQTLAKVRGDQGLARMAAA